MLPGKNICLVDGAGLVLDLNVGQQAGVLLTFLLLSLVELAPPRKQVLPVLLHFNKL